MHRTLNNDDKNESESILILKIMTRRSPTIILLLNMKVNVANTPNLKVITKKNRIIINNNFHPDKKEKAENTKSVTHIAYQQNSFDG